jgi:hypothetical protein
MLLLSFLPGFGLKHVHSITGYNNASIRGICECVVCGMVCKIAFLWHLQKSDRSYPKCLPFPPSVALSAHGVRPSRCRRRGRRRGHCCRCHRRALHLDQPTLLAEVALACQRCAVRATRNAAAIPQSPCFGARCARCTCTEVQRMKAYTHQTDSRDFVCVVRAMAD